MAEKTLDPNRVFSCAFMAWLVLCMALLAINNNVRKSIQVQREILTVLQAIEGKK